jgi:guanylate kinase
MESTHTGCLFTVSAPSGAGKTSLVKALLEHDAKLQVSVSHTTRPMRPGEKDGLNYHFVSQSDFAAVREQGGFIECAEVFGNWYGTSKAWVQAMLESGSDIILEIDWQGAEQIKAWWPATCAIFIFPPSHATLKQRLIGRGQDSPDVIQRRLSEAELEMQHYTLSDYLVINDDFNVALQDLQSIVQAERLRTTRQTQLQRPLMCDLIPSLSLRKL